VPATDPAGPAGVIRVEHDDAHIRVLGAGRQSEASVVIDDFGFIWSDDDSCWYQPEGWRGDRDRWASRLAQQLEDLGIKQLAGWGCPAPRAALALSLAPGMSACTLSNKPTIPGGLE
jgi:hypothetical protein